MERLLTLKEVCGYLNIRYARAAELARTGALRCVRIGRQIRVAPGELQRFVEAGGRPLPGIWRKQPREHAEAAQ
jgi:excisionase family DNA binding protein